MPGVSCREGLGRDARQLGVERIRLLTNNPSKISQLEKYGIEVAGRVSHIFGANVHNRRYLQTKRDKLGHQLTTL